eukprot:1151067-Pelagomonas_calceolata.AAC.1
MTAAHHSCLLLKLARRMGMMRAQMGAQVLRRERRWPPGKHCAAMIPTTKAQRSLGACGSCIDEMVWMGAFVLYIKTSTNWRRNFDQVLWQSSSPKKTRSILDGGSLISWVAFPFSGA